MQEYKEIFSKNNKILLVGVYPPPLGGVSVHIYRLFKLLENEGYEVDVINTSRKGIKNRNIKKIFIRLGIYISFVYKLFIGKFTIIHIHDNDPFLLKACVFIKKIRPQIKLFYTAHNQMFLNKLPKGKKKLFNSFFQKVDLLIAVSQQVVEMFDKNNIHRPQTIIKNAYIQPPLEEESSILSTYPEKLMIFTKTYRPLLIANAFQLSEYENCDLYGLDMCIELTKKLKKQYPQIGFIFALANENHNVGYFNKMKKRIEKLKLFDNFMFLTGQKELWPLFNKADLMIRPTNTDGYGVSIAEAIFLQKPAIASDVCKRPEGTILFENRNIDDLYNKCVNVLKGEKFEN